MGSRSAMTAMLLSVVAATGASVCFWQASTLRTEGQWLLVRGNAQAAEYANSLDSALAEKQLELFEQRRAVLERSHSWQRIQLLLVLFSVVSAFSSYILYLFYRLREQLVDAGDQLDGHDSHGAVVTTGHTLR